MFKDANTTGRGALRRRLTGVGAATATVAIAGALTLAVPMSANAADHPESYAQGQFLSGTVLGTDLAKVLAAEGAVAHNDGTQGTQTQADPFQATALGSIPVGNGTPAQLGLGEFLQLGAINQYAQANNDGSSMGASGAVANNGAIQTNTNQAAPANATFDLSKLLGSQFASTLADLKLELGAVAAQANGDQNKASGSYNLADAKLSFTSPALSQLTEKVDSALDSVNTQLGSLTGQGGDLVQKLTQLLPLSGSGLNLLGNNATVTATIDTGNLKDAVQNLLNAQYGDGSVSFNLENGTVTLDLAKLLGGKLNNLAPGTELINDQVINQVLDSITSTVSTISDQVIAKVKDLLNNATVTLTAHAAVSVPQAPIVSNVCKVIQQVVPGTGSSTGGLGGALGGVLGGVAGAVGQVTNTTVCNPVTTAVAPKLTQLDANIQGSAQQLIGGGATNSTVALQVLGVPVANVNASTVLPGLGSTLSDQLFGTDGAVAKLTSTLDNTLVHPATAALVGSGPISDVLTKLLSVKVNLQETTPGSTGGMAAQTGKIFTETAARVTLLGGTGGSPLATVNLAQASVGPNVTSVTPPTCTGSSCTSGCTTNCGTNGSNPPITPTGSSVDRLATTGISIAALVAAILALLAAGAYLVREGYKRRNTTSVV